MSLLCPLIMRSMCKAESCKKTVRSCYAIFLTFGEIIVKKNINENIKDKPKQITMYERNLPAKIIYHLGMFLTRIFVRLRYKGQEFLPTDAKYVIAANHQSLFDGLWLMGGVPREHFTVFSCMAGADLGEDYGLIVKIMLRVWR